MTEEANRTQMKYLDMFKKFGVEVKQRSLAVRDEVNARVAQYPVSRLSSEQWARITDGQNAHVPLEETQQLLAEADAELALSTGISSSVIERFRRFEKEVSGFWYTIMDGTDSVAYPAR